MSDISPKGYTVTQIKNDCKDCEGQLIVCTKEECVFLCWHIYACDKTCFDYNNGHICKHIHRVHSMNVLEQMQTACDTTADVDFPSLPITLQNADLEMDHIPAVNYANSTSSHISGTIILTIILCQAPCITVSLH